MMWQATRLLLQIPDAGTMKYSYAADGILLTEIDAWGKQTVVVNTIVYNRGYTGHEHLPSFGLINMNARLYNPLLGRFISPDPYVQAPDFTQNFNRFSYCLNNPLKYTDPSGELFGWDDVFVIAATFSINYVSTSIENDNWGWSSVGKAAVQTACDYFTYGGSAPLAHIGKCAFNAATRHLIPSITVSVSDNCNISFSPSVFWGSNGLSCALNMYSSYRLGDWTIGIGGGCGSDCSSLFGSVGYKDMCFSHGVTKYNAMTYNGVEIGAQSVGTYSLMIDKFSLSVSNDNHIFTHSKFTGNDGIKHDYERWRSSAVEMSFGDFSIGTYVLNNDGYKDSNGEYLGSSFKDSAWKNGQTYLAPLYFGYNDGRMTHRIGYSGKFVQHATQNFVHRHIVGCPRFEGYDRLYKGIFSQMCIRDPYYLWGF